MSADLLAFQIKAAELPSPECEYKFFPGRKWRADFAWPDKMLIVEYDGGIYSRGRHVRGKGFELDCEKFNAATLAGWRVLRFTRKHVESGMALMCIEMALEC